jgi:hypothetical protein
MYNSSDDCPKYLKISQRPPDETVEVSIPRERDLTPFYSSLVTLSLEESSTFVPFMQRIHLPILGRGWNFRRDFVPSYPLLNNLYMFPRA